VDSLGQADGVPLQFTLDAKQPGWRFEGNLFWNIFGNHDGVRPPGFEGIPEQETECSVQITVLRYGTEAIALSAKRQRKRNTSDEYTLVINAKRRAMNSMINRRNGLKTGLLALGGLAVISQSGEAASRRTTSEEQLNKAIVGRWFTEFWGKTCNLNIVDELATPDMLLKYSLHGPRRGQNDIKAFMSGFREAFPDLNFQGAADLIAEGDYVVGRWEGGGTHTGPAFNDFLIGSLPAATGRKMHFTGTTVLQLKNGKIVSEIGLDDGLTALQQLGLIRAV
jgi:predicted ester cyclase